MHPVTPTPSLARLLHAAPLLATVLLVGAAGPARAQDTGTTGLPSDFGRGSSRTGERVPIFFPPTPPPLGRALPRGAPAAGRYAPPPEVAAHANEPFYPQLATRLATKTLSARQRQQIEAYRAAKVAAQNDLRTELARVQPLPPAERTAALATFARQQTPALAALEATAEQLRRDLTAGDQTWGALRQWRLNDRDRRAFSPFEIAAVMRSYAYYQHGLLPAQRRLLREIALELQAAGENPEAAAANQPYLFFPPEPARVQLPDDLPADVAAKLATYQSRKSALKKALYDAIHTHDGQTFPFLRGNTMTGLAARQAAPLAELETLAEEIRRGLADLTDAVPLAERTPLPPVLQHRLTVLLREVGAAQQQAVEQIEVLLAASRDLPMQASYRFEGDGLRYVVVATRGDRRGGPPPATGTTARIAAVREQVGAIADAYGRQLAGFLNERDALREEIGRTLNLAQAGRVDQALNTAMRVANARETQEVYREYRVALFQPGLSPEQRRLLFDRVVEKLELPLPRGELQPTMRAATW
jgi:hypothetical protein